MGLDSTTRPWSETSQHTEHARLCFSSFDHQCSSARWTRFAVIVAEKRVRQGRWDSGEVAEKEG